LRLDETVDEVGVMTVELHFLGDIIAALLLPLGPPAAGFVSPVQSSQVLNPSS
jgi:hypothetical protein